MSDDKIVWSNHGTVDYARSLGDEEKFNYLVDRGYDPEMLGNANLSDIIDDDDYMWQEDSEDFEYNVKPMIENQCRDGKVVLLGTVGRWNGSHVSGDIIDPEKLLNLDRDIIDCEIYDNGKGLVYEGHHHDGSITMDMYHFSDDNEAYRKELEALGVFEEYAKWYDDPEDVLNLNVEEIGEYMDFAKVPEVLPRVVNKMNEGLEAPIDEAKSKDPEGLADELEEIKPLADDYGFEYFSSMPFTNYDDDPTSVEYQYPEFFKIAKAFFKEMELVDDPNNGDELDAQWDSIDAHDWDVIIKVCDKLANGAPAQQFEKVFKDGMDDHLGDDKEILKKRAEEDEPLDDEDEDNYAWMDDAENPMDKDEALNEDEEDDDFDDIEFDDEDDDEDKYIGRRVRVVGLHDMEPEDAGFDMDDPEEAADYEEFVSHDGEEGVITSCIEQYDGFEGYWDVKLDDGTEMPAMSDQSLELIDNEALEEDKLDPNNLEDYPWGNPNL